MSGLSESQPAFAFAGAQVTPNSMDRYERINTGILSISTTWFGTAASGTAGQAKALVLINALADYPRNALYAVQGTGEVGGTWVVKGYDQFGQPKTETVAIGTAAAGTPAAAAVGTVIWGKISSGTFTVSADSTGGALGNLGVANGTAGTLLFKLGLLTKIASTTDVKAITWVKANVTTTLNGGTIGSYVDATNHAFSGSAIMAGTEAYNVLLKPTYSNGGNANLAGL